MTPCLVKFIDAKSLYLKLFNLSYVKQDENKLRGRVYSILDKHKNFYYQTLFKKDSSDVKKIWQIIWDFTSTGYNGRNLHKLIYDEKELTNDSELANSFNNFFSGNGKNLSENLSNVNFDPIAPVTFYPAKFFLIPVTHNECSHIIENLKCTGQDLDSLPVKLLIQFRDNFVPTLRDIISQAFLTGTFPNCLKVAIVLPIYKSGDESVPSNNRQISKL